ncbi:MAG: hypothetical protein EPO28_05830, partial [Saprospiraceae bacterium]
MSNVLVNDKIARISDILEQVERLNEMVDFHKNKSSEQSMMRQYVEMRQEFLQELVKLLAILSSVRFCPSRVFGAGFAGLGVWGRSPQYPLPPAPPEAAPGHTMSSV